MKRFFLLFLVLCLSSVTVWAEPQEILDRIQRECLRAYTPKMLRAMLGSEELPEGADDDAEAVIDRFVDVLEVDRGRFYPFLLEDLVDAFELYVGPGTRFLDLGSGDGRVVFYAAALGAEATGIEYDPEVYAVSRRAREALAETLEGRKVELIQDDFFHHSWSGWDVIFYFDLGSFDQHRLRKKIFSELDPGARLVVGHQRVPFPGLELETTFESLHVYRQPETLAEYDPKLWEHTQKEVAEVYALFEDWYNGKVPETEEALKRYADVLEPGFQVIAPRGQTLPRDTVLDMLRGTYGKWRHGEEPGTGTLEIKNLYLRFIEGSVVAVAFEEHHSSGSGGETLKLRTSAVLRLRQGGPNRLQWLHVHQSELRLVILRRAP